MGIKFTSGFIFNFLLFAAGVLLTGLLGAVALLWYWIITVIFIFIWAYLNS